MAVQTQTRVDVPQPESARSRFAATGGGAAGPRVLLRLPDFRARQQRAKVSTGIQYEVDNLEGAPAPVAATILDNVKSAKPPKPVKVRRPIEWKKLLTTREGHSRIAWLWSALRTSGRLLALICREPKLWMPVLGALGLQAAGVVAVLNMDAAPTAVLSPAGAPTVPALLVEPTPLLPLQSMTSPVPASTTPMLAMPMQTPLSPVTQPKPSVSVLPTPTMIPTPNVREPVLPSTSPRLGDPNNVPPWEEWTAPEGQPSTPSSAKTSADTKNPSSNTMTGAGAPSAANQPAMLPESAAPAEPLKSEERVASRPSRAKLKGTIQKLNGDKASEPSRPGLY